MNFEFHTMTLVEVNETESYIAEDDRKRFEENLREFMAITRFNSYEAQVIFKDAALKGFILSRMEKIKGMEYGN